MKRSVAWTLLSFLALAAYAGSSTTRQAPTDVSLTLSRVPHRGKFKPVKVGADGRFRLEEAMPGTWTMTVSVPEGYLDRWIDSELKRRDWKRGGAAPAAVKVAAEGAAAGAAEGAAEAKGLAKESGARNVRITASDAKGVEHQLEFSMVVSVEKTEESGSRDGTYVKPMRWHQLEQGLQFKFSVGERAGGMITGKVERVLTID